MLAAGRPELGPEVSEFTVRPVGPVDALGKFPGKSYCPVNSILERFPVHRRFELRGRL